MHGLQACLLLQGLNYPDFYGNFEYPLTTSVDKIVPMLVLHGAPIDSADALVSYA